MNKKTRVLIGSLGIIIVIIIIWLSFGGQTINIVTDKKEYKTGEVLKINIKNKLLGSVCFSSCYSYYLEHENEIWETYSYRGCQETDLAKDCLGLGQAKAFEIVLPQVKEGVHRIAIPVCKDCKEGDYFKEAKKFYSNMFEIK